MDRHHHNAHRAGLAAPERARVNPAGLASLGAAVAAAAGLSPPQVGAPPAGGNGEGRGRDQGKADTLDCADHLACIQPGVTDRKRVATLRARLALAGWGLIRTDPGDGAPVYFATRWNMPRELRDLAAVEAFADRVGAAR